MVFTTGFKWERNRQETRAREEQRSNKRLRHLPPGNSKHNPNPKLPFPILFPHTIRKPFEWQNLKSSLRFLYWLFDYEQRFQSLEKKTRNWMRESRTDWGWCHGSISIFGSGSTSNTQIPSQWNSNLWQSLFFPFLPPKWPDIIQGWTY